MKRQKITFSKLKECQDTHFLIDTDWDKVIENYEITHEHSFNQYTNNKKVNLRYRIKNKLINTLIKVFDKLLLLPKNDYTRLLCNMYENNKEEALKLIRKEL